MFPKIMKYLPTLLPCQFMTIISERKNTAEDTPEEILLYRLEKLLTPSDVWKLGFNYVRYKYV